MSLSSPDTKKILNEYISRYGWDEGAVLYAKDEGSWSIFKHIDQDILQVKLDDPETHEIIREEIERYNRFIKISGSAQVDINLYE